MRAVVIRYKNKKLLIHKLYKRVNNNSTIPMIFYRIMMNVIWIYSRDKIKKKT